MQFQRLRPQLDATFDLETNESGVDLILHARYGGRRSLRATNVDYFPALELLLRRLADLGAAIEAVDVDSGPSRQLAPELRRLPLSYPILLTQERDLAGLRRRITAEQRGIARAPDAKPSGGNNHKRIRISLRLPVGVDIAAVAAHLTGSRS
ncbi:MAG: hypothetical protein R8F63_00655 [Acidimicrobiales bacterium]|nr:hypothetical protein [Acidimicrobiales bacterium]